MQCSPRRMIKQKAEEVAGVDGKGRLKEMYLTWQYVDSQAQEVHTDNYPGESQTNPGNHGVGEGGGKGRVIMVHQI